MASLTDDLLEKRLGDLRTAYRDGALDGLRVSNSLRQRVWQAIRSDGATPRSGLRTHVLPGRTKVAAAVAASLLAVSVATGYSLASGSLIGRPFCEVVRRLPLPPGKQAVAQAYCASIEATHPVTPAKKGVKVPPPPNSGPEGGPAYGIVGGGGLTPPPWAQPYAFTSTWLGEDRLVYAGSLAGDRSVGVVVVATRFSTPIPEEVAEYRVTGHGALTLVGASGSTLDLEASDGTRVTFDVRTGALKTH